MSRLWFRSKALIFFLAKAYIFERDQFILDCRSTNALLTNKSYQEFQPESHFPFWVEVDEAFGSSYQNYTDLCASKGGRLCTFDEYCPAGEFGARFDETIPRYHDSYAPFYKSVGDNFNNWLQVNLDLFVYAQG